MILMHGRLIPHHAAIVTVTRVVAYGALAQGILKAEEFLRQKGVRKGQLIGVTHASPAALIHQPCISPLRGAAPQPQKAIS